MAITRADTLAGGHPSVARARSAGQWGRVTRELRRNHGAMAGLVSLSCSS